MKVKIEIDAEPEEFRRFFGLPDVVELQNELMTKIREKVSEGVEGYDPAKLMEPFLPDHLRGFEGLQKAFWSTMSGAAGAAKDDKKP